MLVVDAAGWSRYVHVQGSRMSTVVNLKLPLSQRPRFDASESTIDCREDGLKDTRPRTPRIGVEMSA